MVDGQTASAEDTINGLLIVREPNSLRKSSPVVGRSGWQTKADMRRHANQVVMPIIPRCGDNGSRDMPFLSLAIHDSGTMCVIDSDMVVTCKLML